MLNKRSDDEEKKVEEDKNKYSTKLLLGKQAKKETPFEKKLEKMDIS